MGSVTTDKPPAWGKPPWEIAWAGNDGPAIPLTHADLAIVGGGFTGLAAAAFFSRLAPGKKIVLLEANGLGAGASGRTGGMVLAESAAGDLPGLGNVLDGFVRGLRELEIDDCELALPGAWEIGREKVRDSSPMHWNDAGILRVVNEVPGGTVNPGKLIAGLARAAQRGGVILCQGTRVQKLHFGSPIRLELRSGALFAEKVLLASNAYPVTREGLQVEAHPRLTLAVATEPLPEAQLRQVGLAHGKAFYTVDLPYLWGRVMQDSGIVFGSGLVDPGETGGLESINIHRGEAAAQLHRLETRIHGLHPVLHNIKITHRWGGPILFTPSLLPIFIAHPRSKNVLVCAGYNGHGVALSVYLGQWAAAAFLGRRVLPDWSEKPGARDLGWLTRSP